MFKDRYRYFILLLGWICLSSIASNMIALNFTLICMSSPATTNGSIEKQQSTQLKEVSIQKRTGIKNNIDKTHFGNKSTQFKQSPEISNLVLQTPQPNENFNETQTQNSTSTSGDTSHVTIVPVDHQEHAKIFENKLRPHAPVFDYSTQQKAWLMWSVGIGSLIGTFPFSWLCTRYGARYILFAAGIISTLSTALIPLAAIHFGFNYFLFLRFLQGVAYSADFATIGMICSRWASLKQYALFISVLTCFTPLSTTVTNAVSGVICESRYGWPLVFYVHSTVCFFLFILWLIFYNDHPSMTRHVSAVELEKIHRDKTKGHIDMDKYVPYKAILTDKLIWVIWLNAFVDIFSGIYTLMYIPSYFKFVLNFSVQETGFFGSLPTLLNIPTRIIFGYFSDKFSCIPERAKLIAYNTAAVGIPGVVFLAVGFVPAHINPLIVVLMFITMHMFFSVSGGGFYKCAALYSRQYYHFVIANIQFVKCLSLFFGPVLMTIFVRDETIKEQWRIIFIIFAVLLFLSNFLFCAMATDTQAEFTIVGSDQKEEKRNGVSLPPLNLKTDDINMK